MNIADLKHAVSNLEPQRHHYMNEAVTRVMYLRVARPGDCVIDIGANTGAHTGQLSKRVTVTGEVHAIEPNPQHWPGLLSIGSNVRLWPFAAGDELSIEGLDIPIGLDGWASLLNRRNLLPDHKFVQNSTVQVRLDDIEEIAKKDIRFVKCDVEGREYEALRGLRETIRRTRPFIVLENGTAELCVLLASLNYTVQDLFGERLQPALPVLPNCAAFPSEIDGARDAFILPEVEMEAVLHDASTRDLEPPMPAAADMSV